MADVDGNGKKREVNSYELLGYIVIVLGAFLILIGMIMFKFIGNSAKLTEFEVERYGQFGQFIGGVVGSIWALAGVLLFFATLNYQKKEFEQQRLELEKTQKIFKQQDFSSLFLNIISQHNTYMNGLVGWGTDDSSWKGSNFFALFKNKVLSSFEEKILASADTRRPDHSIKEYFHEAFVEQYTAYQHELEPYFKNLRLLFDIVHKYRNETLEKGDYYTHILKSSISSNELFLIYHAAVFDIFTELKKYHRAFNLFENLTHEGRVEYIVEKKSKQILLADRKEPRMTPLVEKEPELPLSKD